MRFVPSALLRDAAAAVERMEKADSDMRSGWPNPAEDVICEWTASRRAAEAALAHLKGELE